MLTLLVIPLSRSHASPTPNALVFSDFQVSRVIAANKKTEVVSDLDCGESAMSTSNLTYSNLRRRIHMVLLVGMLDSFRDRFSDSQVQIEMTGSEKWPVMQYTMYFDTLATVQDL